MPRNLHPGASTLRNRIRITNKTRLKIHQGNLEADALLIPDEDEEKHHLTNLVAGVDAEDANEHHLQAVLSESHRNSINISRPTRGAEKAAAAARSAYIPTPDSTGVVSNYDELYPPAKWKDPTSFVSSSATVEEACTAGLANGFSYFMDERDKEWLDKNNEEARGEGTSAQGAMSTTATSTRASARSAKAKGKEPEVSQPLVISEDEFELVMGLFEKETHEKTEFLHHGLENGMSFPLFSEYQDAFSSALTPSVFASYTVPSWIPAPANLIRISRAIYPYWKERRLERGGHKIIPTLNFDESDNLNESYVCFRRREIKAVRKTRASQTTSSDKLVRLQTEFAYPLELAKAILARETQKKECVDQSQHLWEKRMALADLKRNFPLLNDKADEELLVDKEKPKKTDSSRPIKIRTELGTPVRPEVAMRPRERTALIRETIESTLNRQKEQDHHWEDQVDNPYQPPLVPYYSRFFKFVAPVTFSTSESSGDVVVQPRAVRLRRGRGGRMLVDRRDVVPRRVLPVKRSALFALHSDDSDDDMEVDQEETEKSKRLIERWRFDMDDVPAVGPSGPDEEGRILVDDYDPKYIRHAMTLLTDADQQSLMTDAAIPLSNAEGRLQMAVPFRLGVNLPMVRRDPQGNIRSYVTTPGVPQGVALLHPAQQVNGTPVAMQQQLKKMPPPTALPQMRISSNGGMRAQATTQSMQGSSHTSSHSPPSSASLPQPMATGSNGLSRAAITMPHVEGVKSEINSTPAALSGAVQISQPHQADLSQSHDLNVNGIGASPPKQTQLPIGMATNGYLTPLSSYAATALANTGQFTQQQGLTLQQMQNLKSAFANIPPGQDLATFQANIARSAGQYLHVPNGTPSFNMAQSNASTNMNLKFPATRQMQMPWAASNPQKPGPVVNGMDGQTVNGSMSPALGHAAPVRTPSANGIRSGMRIPNGQLNAHSISPHHQHSPSPMPSVLAQSTSPPRLPHTPTMARASPSLQHQQAAGSSKSGY